jgi:hypothetical protein
VVSNDQREFREMLLARLIHLAALLLAIAFFAVALSG